MGEATRWGRGMHRLVVVAMLAAAVVVVQQAAPMVTGWRAAVIPILHPSTQGRWQP